ncbi:MAG: nitrogen fixation negative regulator NifL [Methylococcaceae bacterium]|nr:nitrogen fixation negative regulator NifL [Methylococcaceae bacterium]
MTEEIIDLSRLDSFVNNNLQIQCEMGKTLPISLFLKAVEHAPVAISITDRKANILYINKAFTDVTGYVACEIIGENESKLSAKSTPREVYQTLWKTISQKEVWQGQLVNCHKNGQRYLADLTISPMLDESGAISHYIGMHRDITQSHQAGQLVDNQKQLIESVVNGSPVAMVVLDADHKIILDNQKYKMLVSDMGMPEPALYFIAALQEEMPDLWVSKRNFNQREVRFEGTGQGRTRWFYCSGNWFSEDDTDADNYFTKHTNSYLLLSLNDVTLQRRQQEKMHLQTLRNILAEEEQIRSIRETLLGAMHQIRQPMNQIGAAIQIMAQRNDSQNHALKELLNQVQRMGEETLATLQLCVPEIPETAVIPVNLNQLLHEVLMLYSHTFLANGVIIDWLPTAILPSILGSENKLRMLFKQLLDNAVDAMNRAGSKERYIKISTSVSEKWVNVSIADSGPGIPANQHSKVFEPFFTTQNMGGIQAGMGLVMAREIVSQHNGIIIIDPVYTDGCCWSISFPFDKKSFRTDS